MPEFDSTIRYAPIPDYPDYCAGSDGSIWSCRTLRGKRDESQWHRLVPVRRGRYLAVLLYSAPGKRKLVNIHVAILKSFAGKPMAGMVSRHLDGNRYNCAISNLAWGTNLENHADKQRHGTTARGERHGISKNTTAEIIELRKLAAEGKPMKQLAAMFRLSLGGVEKIISRQTWKHV